MGRSTIETDDLVVGGGAAGIASPTRSSLEEPTGVALTVGRGIVTRPEPPIGSGSPRRASVGQGEGR